MPFQETQGVQIKGRDAEDFATLTPDGAKQRLDVSAITLGTLVPFDYDFISLDPPAQPTSIVYKIGGAGGSVVATLTLTYTTAGDVSTVTRT